MNLKKLAINSSKGFTLIELLVVIGILGVLAAALIATLDPVEQLNRGSDANLKSASVTYVQAVNAYYSQHGVMPWNNPSSSALCQTANTANNALSGDPCTADLQSDGELKASFGNVNGLASINVNQSAANTLTACFLPKSKAVEQATETKYTTTGGNAPAANRCGTINAANCYWCAQ